MTLRQGVVQAGDAIEIVGMASETGSDVITQVESFGEVLEAGRAGDNVGVLLRKTAHTVITKGQVLAKAGSVTPHCDFEAEVYVLKKEAATTRSLTAMHLSSSSEPRT